MAKITNSVIVFFAFLLAILLAGFFIGAKSYWKTYEKGASDMYCALGKQGIFKPDVASTVWRSEKGKGVVIIQDRRWSDLESLVRNSEGTLIIRNCK